jgi:ADP-ribose pyrophosphatase YjhB (NUDIX family)
MKKPGFYCEDASVVIPIKFLEESAYADALEAFVVVCADCLLINRNRGTIYLAKRKSKPMSDWWFIGGRVFAGEREEVAVHRCLERETGLDIIHDRFRFLDMKRYIFKNRQQEPQEKSCDSLCYIFGLDASEEEVTFANQNLDSNEYDTSVGLQEFDLGRLHREGVFLAIIDLYESIFG